MRQLKEAGFTLLEALIGIALMSAASLAFVNFMQQQQKSQKSVIMTAEISEVRTLISQTISKLEACEATFIGMAPGDNLKEVRTTNDLSKPAFMKTGEKFRQYNVYVKSIHMLSRDEQREPSRNIVDSGIDANGVGYAFIEVTFSKGANEKAGQAATYYGGKDIKVVFPIRAIFSNSTLLAGCQKDSTLPDQCRQNAIAQGAPTSYTANFAREETAPFAEKVFDITGCGAPGGYMLECNIYKDTFPITNCAN